MADHWAEAGILVELGHAQRTQGQLDAARQSWQLALSTFEEFGDTRAGQLRANLEDLNAQGM